MDSTCLILIVFIITVVYWYLKNIHNYWSSQNIPSIPNPNVIFGHMLPIISMKENVTNLADKAYKNFNSSMVGFYFMRTPGIIVRDPDLVKSVLQTSFSSFHDNLIRLNEQNDPIIVKSPFFTSDMNLWKLRRARTASNMSGKKLRYLSVIVQEVCNKMIAFTERKIEENDGSYECELKKFFTRYTGEIVANAAFAIEGQSFEDNPERLSFAVAAKTLLEPTFINGVKQTLLFYLPAIAHFIGVSWTSKKIDAYTRQNIEAVLKKRQQKGEKPNDYLQFSADSTSDLNDILSDIVNFHAEVYETSSTVPANLFYYLSLNPEIQSKLRDHVASVLKDTNGQVTYDSLKDMTYLDQVVNECMRLVPPLGVQMKCCTEDITLKGSDGLTCQLQPGNVVFIPDLSLQNDGKYWPNPSVFDPERFSPENQANNNKYTFLPFGEGPRMCPGIRLGMMVIKYATASLITKYSIEHSTKTKEPLEMEPSSLLIMFKGGLWARFRKL